MDEFSRLANMPLKDGSWHALIRAGKVQGAMLTIINSEDGVSRVASFILVRLTLRHRCLQDHPTLDGLSQLGCADLLLLEVRRQRVSNQTRIVVHILNDFSRHSHYMARCSTSLCIYAMATSVRICTTCNMATRICAF